MMVKGDDWQMGARVGAASENLQQAIAATDCDLHVEDRR